MSAPAKGKKDEPEKKPRRRIKKVAGHGGGHHGGSWKVAYADFVTAMMALFLVLWLLSQADQKLKASVASYFRTAGVFDTQAGGILGGPKNVSQDPSPDAAVEEAMFNQVAEELKKRVSSSPDLAAFKDRVKISVTEEGLSIQIIDKADRVTFASGSAELNAEAKLLLAEIATAICPLSNSISIGGHTDHTSFPAGSTYTNWELSADRANAARRQLETKCVKAEQVRRVVGYADTELLYPNYPFAAANRRINIVVMRTGKSVETEEDKKPKVIEEKSPSKAQGDEKDKDHRDEKEKLVPKKSADQESGEAVKKSRLVTEEPGEETSDKAQGKGKAAAKKGDSAAAEASSAPAKHAHK